MNPACYLNGLVLEPASSPARFVIGWLDLARRSRRTVDPDPGSRKLPGDRENDRTDEETDDAVRQGAADDPDQDHERRRGQAAPHHQWLQNVVEKADDHEEYREQ